MYERRDRAEVGLGKREFLSHCWGGDDGGRARGWGANERGDGGEE